MKKQNNQNIRNQDQKRTTRSSNRIKETTQTTSKSTTKYIQSHSHLKRKQTHMENKTITPMNQPTLKNQTHPSSQKTSRINNEAHLTQLLTSSPLPNPIPQGRQSSSLVSSPPSSWLQKDVPTHSERNFSPESSGSPIPVQRSMPPIINTPHSPDTSRSSSGSPIPTKSSNSKLTHSIDHINPSTSPKKIKHSNLAPTSLDQLSPSSSLKTSSLSKDEKLNNTLPARPRPVRLQRPIRKQAVAQLENLVPSTSATPALPPDEDDFFNLSSHNPIQFVSKTLGLNQASVGPKNSSPAKSLTPGDRIEPNPRNQILVDLDSDSSEDEETTDSDDSDDLNRSVAFDKSKSKSKPAFRNLPSWTKASQVVEVVSSSEGEKESLSDIDKLVNRRQDQKKLNAIDPKGKRRAGSSKKRNRPARPAKSRSPTPPPLQDRVMIQNAIDKVYQRITHKDLATIRHKQELEALRRADELELMKVLKDVDVPPTNVLGPNDLNYHHKEGDQVIGIECLINFHTSMVLDPAILSTMSKGVRERVNQPINFQMKSNQKFELVYQKFHQLSGIPIHQLVVSCDNIKLSPFVTPESVSIFSQATLKVYDSVTWQGVTSLRRQRIHLSANPEESHGDSRNKNAEAAENAEPPSSDCELIGREKELNLDSNHQPIDPFLAGLDQGNGTTTTGLHQQELINIVVRNKDKSQVELLVKPITTFKAIVKNFLIEINQNHPLLSALDDLTLMAKKIKITFDGQLLALNSTVQDNDICDEDILDFTFL